MIASMPVDLKAVFAVYLIVLGIVAGGAAAFGALLYRMSKGRFLGFCRKISDFCAEAGIIDDGNLEQFDATCMDENADPAFLEGWNSFKEVRFGYPGEFIDREKVDAVHDSRRFKLAVLLFSLISFLFSVVLSVSTICLVSAKYAGEYQSLWALAICGLILPLIPLAVFLPLCPERKNREAFDLALEDLDVCVRLQRMVERKVDSAMLEDIERRIAEIVRAEQNKPVPSKVEQLAEAKPRKKIRFAPFVELLNQCIERIKTKSRLKKLAALLVAAYGRFREPDQRAALKDSVRRFVVSYAAATRREREAAAASAGQVQGTYSVPAPAAPAYVPPAPAYVPSAPVPAPVREEAAPVPAPVPAPVFKEEPPAPAPEEDAPDVPEEETAEETPDVDETETRPPAEGLTPYGDPDENADAPAQEENADAPAQEENDRPDGNGVYSVASYDETAVYDENDEYAGFDSSDAPEDGPEK